MQTGLALRKSPTKGVPIAIGLFAALAIGGSLGYTLKPASVTTGLTHTIVVPAPPALGNSSCVFVEAHRGC